MSKKPPKHSEAKRAKESAASRMKKSWPGPRDRARKVSLRPEHHLIVTEGTKTEPLYFEEIGRRVNDAYHGDWVTVEVKGAGMSTMSLLEHAQSLAESNVRGYTHVWVVYDRDSFAAADFNAVASACETEGAGGARFHAIWSNECFELWYLLHFEFLQADLSRDMYTPKLDAHLAKLGLGPYRKNDPGMFVALEPLLEIAIENARKLEESNVGKTPEASRPGTKVHKLVEHLRPYMGKANGATHE